MSGNLHPFDLAISEEISKVLQPEITGVSANENFKKQWETGTNALIDEGSPLLSDVLDLTPDRVQRLSASVEGIAKRISGVENVIGEDIVGTDWQELIANATLDELRDIVIKINRPVYFIQDKEAVVTGNSDWADLLRSNVVQETLKLALPAVGRINLEGANESWVGTGFLVAGGRIVTSQHVAKFIFDLAGPYNKKTNASGDAILATIDFIQEHQGGTTRHATFEIESASYIAPIGSPDIAILDCPKAIHHAAPLTFSSDVFYDETVAAIGYPGDEPGGLANDERFRDLLFAHGQGQDGVYDVKRIAPGYLRPASSERHVLHDCSVLGGNSGSPLINLLTGEVVGVHRKGAGMNIAVHAKIVEKILSDLDAALNV